MIYFVADVVFVFAGGGWHLGYWTVIVLLLIAIIVVAFVWRRSRRRRYLAVCDSPFVSPSSLLLAPFIINASPHSTATASTNCPLGHTFLMLLRIITLLLLSSYAVLLFIHFLSLRINNKYNFHYSGMWFLASRLSRWSVAESCFCVFSKKKS